VKKFLEEIGIPELTLEQIEKLCEIGEKAARDHVSSKISSRKISELNITVDTEGEKPVTVNVEVEITLSPVMKNFDAEKLAREASEKAFASIKEYLRELACKYKK
jgi:hypothetical protein